MKTNLEETSKVETISFFSFLTDIINRFENKNYTYHILPILTSDNHSKQIYMACEENYFNKPYLKESELEELLQSNRAICFGISLSPEISLIDTNNNQFNINLNNTLLERFPYLESIIFDLIDIKQKNGKVDFNLLSGNIDNLYASVIKEWQSQKYIDELIEFIDKIPDQSLGNILKRVINNYKR